MKTILILVGLVAVLAAAALLFLYSGVYDVAASDPDEGLVAWALETAQERSVRSRAEGIPVPPLEDPQMLRTGLVHYHEMCVTCHGAPGVPASEIGMGLNPSPPLLGDEVEESSPGELFWIVKNGIKMTGMPAFGVTHSDEQIWAIVAFLKRLPGVPPEEYRRQVEAAGLGPAGAGHGHDGDMPEEATEAAEPAAGDVHHHADGSEHRHDGG